MKRPRDPNQLAKHVIGIAIGEIKDAPPVDSAAAAMGRKGGAARAAALTPKRRTTIAKKAARARWNRDSKSGA